MENKTLLITGFDPFGRQSINPAWLAVCRLPESIGEWRLEKLQVPTVYGRAAQLVQQRAAVLQPQAILCVGQAAGRSAVTPELIGINYQHASLPDNAGVQPQDMPIIPDGPAAIFSTLPVQAMAGAIRAAGLPGEVSYTAGSFVCNDLLYRLLYHFRGSPVRVGFVHVPLSPEQVSGQPPAQPVLPLEKSAAALAAAIGAM